MKKRFATFLVGLSLVAPVLSGCGSSNGNNPFNPGGGDGGNIANYTGSNTKVGTIQNVPVSAYKETTKNAVYQMFDTFSGNYHSSDSRDNADEMMDYMISMGIGDNLAVAFTEAAMKWYRFGLEKSFDSKEFNTACYDVLKILNSFDYSKIANVFEKVNKAYTESEQEWAKEKLKTITLEQYVNPRVGNLYYRDYLDLSNHSSSIKSAELRGIVSEYKGYFDSYVYSSNDRSNYDSYIKDLREEANRTYEVIPSEIITFVKKQGSNIKSVVVNDLKLIVDAYGELVFSFVENTILHRDYEGYNENRAILSNSRYGYNEYFYEQSQYYSASSMMLSMIKTLTQNKAVTLGLLKSILTDSKFAEVALDFVLTFVIPTLKKSFTSTEALNQIEKLRQRVSALSSGHIASIANLVLNILNQVSAEDYETIINLVMMMSSEESSDSAMQQLFALGDKYSSKFEKVLSSLSGKDKANILAVGQIFGIDIVAQLQEFLRIYNNKNLSTQEGYELFQTSIYVWLMNIRMSFEENFSFLWEDDYDGDNYGTSKPQEPQPLSRYQSIGGGYYLNAELDQTPYGKTQSEISDSVELYFHDVNGNYLYDGSYYNLSYYYLHDYNYMVNDRGRDYARDYYGNQLADLFEYLIDGNFSISVSVNNSSIGTIPYSVYVFVNNNGYTYEGEIKSTPNNATYLEKTYIDYIDGSKHYSYSENGYSHAAVEVNTFIYDYNDGSVMDSSTEGWNVYYNQNYRCYCVYFVFNPSKYQVKIDEYEKEVGVYVVGDSDFIRTPYSWYHYRFEGLDFGYTKSDSLDFSSSLVSGKAANKLYTVTVDGIEYEYVIVSKPSKPTYSSYSFYIDGVDYYDEVSKPIDVTATLNVYNEYRLSVDNMIITIDDSDYSVDVRLTNFTYMKGILKFTYSGHQYTFYY